MPIQVLVMYILFLSYYTTPNMDVHRLQHKYLYTFSFKIPKASHLETKNDEL